MFDFVYLRVTKTQRATKTKVTYVRCGLAVAVSAAVVTSGCCVYLRLHHQPEASEVALIQEDLQARIKAAEQFARAGQVSGGRALLVEGLRQAEAACKAGDLVGTTLTNAYRFHLARFDKKHKPGRLKQYPRGTRPWPAMPPAD